MAGLVIGFGCVVKEGGGAGGGGGRGLRGSREEAERKTTIAVAE